MFRGSESASVARLSPSERTAPHHIFTPAGAWTSQALFVPFSQFLFDRREERGAQWFRPESFPRASVRAVKLAWVIYQKIIAAYADANPRRGKKTMTALIDSIRRGLPAGLEEIAELGRTLWRRRTDILAFFDHHTSNGPTEAINGRLEALRRNALGFRNLTHYRWRSLLHSGALHQLVNAL